MAQKFGIRYSQNNLQWDDKINDIGLCSNETFRLECKKVCADLFRHLPKGLEELNIGDCTFQRITMDALLDWLENPATNLKKLYSRSTCIGGSSDGKDCGICLANILARDDCQLEGMALSHTDVIGSRNVDVLIDSLHQNQSLNEYFNVEVMNALVQQVEREQISLYPWIHLKIGGILVLWVKFIGIVPHFQMQP